MPYSMTGSRYSIKSFVDIAPKRFGPQLLLSQRAASIYPGGGTTSGLLVAAERGGYLTVRRQ